MWCGVCWCACHWSFTQSMSFLFFPLLLSAASVLLREFVALADVPISVHNTGETTNDHRDRIREGIVSSSLSLCLSVSFSVSLSHTLSLSVCLSLSSCRLLHRPSPSSLPFYLLLMNVPSSLNSMAGWQVHVGEHHSRLCCQLFPRRQGYRRPYWYARLCVPASCVHCVC
jgi:hypothetical protein